MQDATGFAVAHIGDIFRLVKDCSNLRHLSLSKFICGFCTTYVPDGTEFPLESISSYYWHPHTLYFVRGMRFPNLKRFHGRPLITPIAAQTLPLCLESLSATLTKINLLGCRDLTPNTRPSYPRLLANITNFPNLRFLGTPTEFCDPETLVTFSSLEFIHYIGVGLPELEYLTAALRKREARP